MLRRVSAVAIESLSICRLAGTFWGDFFQDCNDYSESQPPVDALHCVPTGQPGPSQTQFRSDPLELPATQLVPQVQAGLQSESEHNLVEVEGAVLVASLGMQGQTPGPGAWSSLFQLPGGDMSPQALL